MTYRELHRVPIRCFGDTSAAIADIHLRLPERWSIIPKVVGRRRQSGTVAPGPVRLLLAMSCVLAVWAAL